MAGTLYSDTDCMFTLLPNLRTCNKYYRPRRIGRYPWAMEPFVGCLEDQPGIRRGRAARICDDP